MIESLAQIVMGLAFGVILGILGAFPLAMLIAVAGLAKERRRGRRT